MHWVIQYIGKPWKADAVPPHSFHCWLLARWVQEKHYNRKCPEYPISNPADSTEVNAAITQARQSGEWIKLSRPIDGCLASLSNVAQQASHVGVYLEIDGGKVLHCPNAKAGVLCQALNRLRMYGTSHVEFYLHRTWL